MAEHNKVGKKGEDLAVRYLLSNNYQILALNYRYLKYEIDIIAKKDETIIFIEVKTRSSAYIDYPENFLTIAQQNRIAEAAEIYLEEIDFQGEIRFDIIAIVQQDLVHFEDAFFPMDE